jgi:hypothetical protein
MMRSSALLTTAAAAVLSAEYITPVFGKASPDFADYVYEPKEIDPEIAHGGLQKLINSGVFTLERNNRPHQDSRKNLPKRGRRMAHHDGGYYSG